MPLQMQAGAAARTLPITSWLRCTRLRPGMTKGAEARTRLPMQPQSYSMVAPRTHRPQQTAARRRREQ